MRCAGCGYVRQGAIPCVPQGGQGIIVTTDLGRGAPGGRALRDAPRAWLAPLWPWPRAFARAESCSLLWAFGLPLLAVGVAAFCLVCILLMESSFLSKVKIMKESVFHSFGQCHTQKPLPHTTSVLLWVLITFFNPKDFNPCRVYSGDRRVVD